MDRTRCSENREDIAQALEQAAALLMRHLADRQGMGLTSSWVLSRLGADGPVRLTALAVAMGVSQPSMTQLVQRLEREGLTTRVRDPQDGRASLVGITDAGRALLAELRRARRSRLAELLANLSAQDETTLSLAMHVALPLIQRLIHHATQPRIPRETTTS